MANPVVVEIRRGSLVESRHRGSIAVVDTEGSLVLALGDVNMLVYPRSAVKAMQALVLMEAGAAERFNLDDEALALACASHGGEPGHVAVAERMLAAAGLDASALECGVHWPSHALSAQALARSGRNATALHNNCSGKHSGFICASRALGVDHRGYTDPAHPVQRAVKAVLQDLTGVEIPDEHRAIDGCSVPTWAISLKALARGFARFGSGKGMAPGRARAAQRLRGACAANPWHVAGTGRFCTAVMKQFGERVFVKTGAEGVFCGAIPELGLGVAIKCDDGAARASEVAMAGVIERLVPLGDEDRLTLGRLLHPTLSNWNGIDVGAIAPAP